MNLFLKKRVDYIKEKVETLLEYRKYLESLRKDYENIVVLAENIKSDFNSGLKIYGNSYSNLEEEILRLEEEAKGDELNEIREIKERINDVDYKNILPISKPEGEAGRAYA